jgi:homocysteine S-methyltransferase
MSYPGEGFSVTVEVVPPASSDAAPLLRNLEGLADQPIAGFSVATNPLAKPHMSALAFSILLQRRTGLPAILHCTTRDHNQLSLQGLLWGAGAAGIDHVLVASGDFVALRDRALTSTVRDLDVFQLVAMACKSGLRAGVVLDPHPEANGMDQAIQRLERKANVGASFVVTQPLYTAAQAETLAVATRHIDLPLVLGILPLRTHAHATFLHDKVAGIAVPRAVRDRMQATMEPRAEGVKGAQQMLSLAQEMFHGACIMPPFGDYELVPEILDGIDVDH